MDGAAAQRSIPQPQPCGLECPPHPRPVRSPAGPVVQEQDRLGMKSQLEGAGLGLPLQGGAWGHDPGSRRPRREAAFREGAGVGGRHTHSSAEREGRKQTPGDQAAWSAAWAADSRGPRPRCRRLRDPARPSSREARRRWWPDMDGRGRLGLGCRGARNTWGARTKSGTVTGETEAGGGGPSGRGGGGEVSCRLGPTSCFL